MSNEALSAAGRHRAVLLDAAAGLEFAIASPIGRGAAWREHVDGELHRLRGALADHTREVEGEDGLLADLVHQAPRLSNRVKMLKKEHRELDEQIGEIIHMLGAMPMDGLEDATEDIRERTLALLGKVSRHRQKGADLVYRAYDIDIGGLG
ncbi:MAG TPA: hypothetical protein VLT15_06720 [Acidimicrobiia bacterium]|nr:hypothetical protein [Acidimicrobiia bacterium]